MSGPQHQRFNTETMSGVQTGSRTAVAHRLRVRGESGEAWARLLWMDEPRRVAVHLPAAVGEPDGPASETGPTLQLQQPDPETVHRDLNVVLQDSGWRPLICGGCGHWRPLAGRQDEDGLALGRCMWRMDASATRQPLPEMLAEQSALAVGCREWTEDAGRKTEDEGQRTEDAGRKTEEKRQRGLRGSGLLVRLGRILGFGKRARISDGNPPREIAQLVTERSGVAAGTEPCLTCQGRMANLGALTVATDEGDPRTFTVWRCRRCRGLFLSDWIDRWERTSSLETEESIHRLSPHEAWQVLERFSAAPGGEHPAARAERVAERVWMDAFLAGRTPLSHQVRQGR